MTGTPLGVTLDQERLERAGVTIAARITLDKDLPIRQGHEVAQELGGRLLVRYMLRDQVRWFGAGSTNRHCVTPTPLARKDTVPVLALPVPDKGRPFAMLLNPADVAEIQGPRWIRGGSGIEYVLPNGFPSSAVLVGWPIQIA